MIKCTQSVLYLVVCCIITVNALLLLKYHSMLEAVEKPSHPTLQTSSGGGQQFKFQNIKPPNLVSSSSDHNNINPQKKNDKQNSKDESENNNNSNDNSDDENKKESYSGPILSSGRFGLPEISETSKSPWGRFLASHNIQLSYSSSSSSRKTNINNNDLDLHFEDEDDVSDILVKKILPIRYWRLDMLVPEAAKMSHMEVHRQDNNYVSRLHKVKHQATVLKFRWPWHLSHAYEKQMRHWVDTTSEREKVFKRFQFKTSLKSLQAGEVGSIADDVAKQIEDVVATDTKLPFSTRRISVSRLRARQILKNTGCNLLRVPFTSPTEDEACVAYLGNIDNWKKLKPLPARYDARTIKFQVEFNEPDLHSVLKVPQRLFPYEAFAEIGAYHADRILGVRRIPPTAYVCIPKSMIRETVKRDGHTVETDEETLKESGVKTYEEWVEKDLLSFALKSAYNVEDHGDCVGTSIQPVISDVHHLLDSALAVPYKTHDTSWHRYFNFSSSIHSKFGPFGESTQENDLPLRFLSAPYAPTILHTAELVAFDFIVGNNDRSPNKNFFVVGSCIDDFSICSEDETSFFTMNRAQDDVGGTGGADAKEDNENLVLGGGGKKTGDKKKKKKNDLGGGGGGGEEENKKSVEQVLSRLDWRRDKSALRRPGAPTFLHLDQGMAFYQTPKGNAITNTLKKGDHSGFCVFRRRFINRLLDLFDAEIDKSQLSSPSAKLTKHDMITMIRSIAVDENGGRPAENGFAKLMEARLPKHALHSAVLTRETFAACERRIRKLLLQVSRCLKLHRLEDVIAP